MLLITFTIVLIFFFIHITDVLNAVKGIFTVISPILYGLVLAYLLNYPYKLFYDHAFKKMGTKHKLLKKFKKPLSLLLAYIIIIGVVTFLISTLIPELKSSIKMLVDKLPEYERGVRTAMESTADFIYKHTGYDLTEQATYSKLISMITGSDTTEFIKNIVTNVVPSTFSTVLGIGTGVYNWVIGLIISVYLLSSKESLLRQSRLVIVAYTPEKFYSRVFKTAYVFNHKCGRFIVGKIIDSAIIGVMCFIGLSIFRFDYPLLISVIIGVFNMIPFFGPIIGAIPTTFLLLVINPMEALGFLVFIIVLQQFDGNILGPKILGETVGISGFWIMVSVIVGGGLFGVPGLLLGVPVFAAIYTLVQEGTFRRLNKKAIAADDIAPLPEDYEPKAEKKPGKGHAIIGKASELINKGKNK